jgi:RNA polymerase sigma-70 factor (ECF subfamily)
MGDFDDVYARHADAVLRYAWRQVGRREIAEELTAEAFLSLYEHWSAVDVAQLPAWLFAVVRNKAIDHWRRRSVEERFVNTLPAEPTTAPHEIGAALALVEHPALKPVHRVCLRLRYGYGMTVAEVARTTGLSETQVKGHLQYSRQLLRRALVKETR